MSMEQLKESLPEYAKDIRLNLSQLFGNIGQSGLTEQQFYGTALALAYALKNQTLLEMLQEEGKDFLPLEIKQAAKIAATIMAMNNIYYRAAHLAEQPELTNMPAALRMNAMLNPGAPKLDFELFSLAISALNGCGMCIQAHIKQLLAHDLSMTGIQTSLRLAAVLNATDQALAIE